MRSLVRKGAKKILARALPWVISCLRGSNGGSLWVLLFHEVSDEPWKRQLLPGIVMTREEFRRILEVLRCHFQVASLWDSLQRLEQHRLTGPTAAITFDDGYSGFFSDALPILKEMKMHTTAFVCGDPVFHRRWTWDWALYHLRMIVGPEVIEGLIGPFRDTPEGILQTAAKQLTRDLIDSIHCEAARHSLPDADPIYLTEEQLRLLPSDTIEIGSHTWFHPRLEMMPEKDWQWEFTENHNYLSQFPAYRPIQAIPFGQRNHFSLQMIDWASRNLGLRTFASYGGICRAPRPGRDYFRISVDGVPASALPSRLALHGVKSLFDPGIT